jgi:shikimate kinase
MQIEGESRKNIILTGFMGTGKTTVGKLLAKQLGYEFMDTDELIEARQGRTIPQIFRESGEVAFRQMEADLAQELAGREGLVIATGGRLMLDPVNAAALSRQGWVFCLVANVEEILRRLTKDKQQHRPLLAGADPGERIVALLRQREEAYRRFPQVMTDDKRPLEVVQELMELIDHAPFGGTAV